jgi:hypothetical protein
MKRATSLFFGEVFERCSVEKSRFVVVLVERGKAKETKMADQEVRDDRDRLVGRIRTLWDGRHELRDDRHRLRGY